MRCHVSRCDSEITIITTDRLPRSAQSINHLFFFSSTFSRRRHASLRPLLPRSLFFFFCTLSKFLLRCQGEIINIVIVHLFLCAFSPDYFVAGKVVTKSNGFFCQMPQRLKAMVVFVCACAMHRHRLFVILAPATAQLAN